MLNYLSLQNFVTVDQLAFDFSGGFTAITGETGAGKSIILDALGLVLGDKSDFSQIRNGKDEARITASFDISSLSKVKSLLEELDLAGADPSELVIRRTIDRKGKSRQFVNDVPSTLGQLKNLGALLVDIHGQNEHQSINGAATQREVLDAYGGLDPLVEEVGSLYSQWKAAKDKLEEAKADNRSRELEKENLELRLRDYEELAPKEGEYKELNERYNILANGHDIMEAVGSSLGRLDGEKGMQSQVGRSIRDLERFQDIHPAIAEALGIFGSVEAELAEISQGLNKVLSGIDLDPEELREVDDRLSKFTFLARKYNHLPDELHEKHEEIKNRLKEITELGDLEALEKKVKEALAAYMAKAEELGQRRSSIATELEGEITRLMRTLAMSNAVLKISLDKSATPQPWGLENVEFLVAMNKGSDLRPMSKVASGGELSRISLSIQVVMGKTSRIPTLIFDEVDTGIGGAEGEIVGRSLRSLGENYQVLAITHLGQVASFANTHWKVKKEVVNDLTVSSVSEIDGEERVNEIARMIGGQNLTETTLNHARELLETGGNYDS